MQFTTTPLVKQSEADAYPASTSLEPKKQRTPTKGETTNNLIGWILQIGVILSAAIILIGLILLPIRPGGLSVQRLLNFPQTLSQVGGGLLVLQPQAVIALGLLLLIAIPVIRVAASVIAFALEGDRKYVVITLIVLTILLCSVLLLGNITTGQHHNDVHHLHFSLSVILLIFVGSIAAAFIGTLAGLGAGFVLVTLLLVLFGCA